MASKPRDDDCFLCPICFEQFKDPKSLPCLHTFCQACLNSYVLSRGKTKGKTPGQVPCPVCRQNTQVPDPSAPLEKFVDLMPPNHLIVSLMDRSKAAPQTVKDKLCDPCSQGGDELLASTWCTVCSEALCDNCALCHKRMKQTRNHTTKPISEASEKSTRTEQLDVDEPCSEHAGKMLEVYCIDHKAMCCVICLATKHRKCENISTFEEMVKGGQSDSVEDFKQNLSEIGKMAGLIISDTKKNIKTLDVQHDKMANEVSSTVQYVIKKLERLNTVFLLQLKNAKVHQNFALVERKRKMEVFLDSVKSGYKLLQRVCQEGSPKQVFITKEKLRTQLKSHALQLKLELKDSNNVKQTLHIDKTLLSVKDTVIETAKLKSTYSKDSVLLDGLDYCCTSLSREHKQPKQDVDIKDLEISKSFSTSMDICITGGTFIPDGKMVFCSSRCRYKLIMFDEMGELLLELPVLYCPFDVTSNQQNEILVSANSRSCIKRYDTGLMEIGKIPCKRRPEGIACFNDNIIVGYRDVIDIITVDGKCVRSFHRTVGLPGCRVTVPTASKNFFYIKNNGVVCLSFDRRQIFEFSKDNFVASGVDFDCYGNVYVCGHDFGHVFVLSPDGSQSRDLVPGYFCNPFRNPFGIGFDRNMFAIGFDQNRRRFFLATEKTVTVYDVKTKK